MEDRRSMIAMTFSPSTIASMRHSRHPIISLERESLISMSILNINASIIATLLAGPLNSDLHDLTQHRYLHTRPLEYKFIYKLKRAVARSRYAQLKMLHKKDYKFCMVEIEMRPHFGQEFYILEAESATL